jgi:hypothetical protein
MFKTENKVSIKCGKPHYRDDSLICHKDDNHANYCMYAKRQPDQLYQHRSDQYLEGYQEGIKRIAALTQEDPLKGIDYWTGLLSVFQFVTGLISNKVKSFSKRK